MNRNDAMTSVELRALEVGAEVMLDGDRGSSWEPRPKWVMARVTRKTPKQLVISTSHVHEETHRIDVDRARVVGAGYHSSVYPATPDRKAENALDKKRQKTYYALSDFAKVKTKHLPDDVCDELLAMHVKLTTQDLIIK